MRAQAARAVGEEAARAIYAAVTFEIEEVRPIVDLGQGWEKSIEWGAMRRQTGMGQRNWMLKPGLLRN